MKKSPTRSRPLSAEARSLRKAIVAEYGVEDPAGLAVLHAGLEALDRMREAQRAIAQDGVTVRDRFGQLKAHPLLPVERDARAQFLGAIKQLNLDLEPLHDGTGRPDGGGAMDT